MTVESLVYSLSPETNKGIETCNSVPSCETFKFEKAPYKENNSVTELNTNGRFSLYGAFSNLNVSQLGTYATYGCYTFQSPYQFLVLANCFCGASEPDDRIDGKRLILFEVSNKHFPL